MAQAIDETTPCVRIIIDCTDGYFTFEQIGDQPPVAIHAEITKAPHLAESFTPQVTRIEEPFATANSDPEQRRRTLQRFAIMGRRGAACSWLVRQFSPKLTPREAFLLTVPYFEKG